MIGNQGRANLSFLAVLGLLAACQPGDQLTRAPLSIDTIGDTLILHEQPVGQWEEPRRLELDLVMGGTGSEDDLTFGRVSNIALEASGGILVEDNMAGTVIRIGADGGVTGFVGGRGEGPGEFLFPMGIVVLKDGRIAVRDNRLFVISLFESDGTFIDRWPLRELLRSSWGLEVDQDGLLAVRADFEDYIPYTEPAEGLVILSPDGSVVDSIPPPETPWEGVELWGHYHPKKHLVRWSSGFVVVGVSDGYHFDIRRPNQTIRVEQPFEPVPVSPEERGAFDVEMALSTGLGDPYLENYPPPPDFKAAYSRILVTRTGQIWVFRHGVGEQWSTREVGEGLVYPYFREPLQIDVFDQNGRFLGVVEGHAKVDPKVVSNDTVWAVVTGELDEHYVARYLVR